MIRLVIYCAYLSSAFFPLSVAADASSPSLVPTSAPIQNPPLIYPYHDRSHTTSVDVLVAALFLIAAGWLVLAIIYSVLILIVVRMRARGEFDIYDENFGRLFLLGTRCYIPLGCILRRHVVAMQSRNRRQSLHIMTREERRNAMELILTQSGDREQDVEKLEEPAYHVFAADEAATLEEEEGQQDDIYGSEDEPMCSICLMEYEEGDVIFRSPSCVHRFHQDCLLGWLERRNHTECPCCREPMVSDEDVWETVQQLRREQRKIRRQENCRNSLIGCLFGCAKKRTASEEGSFEMGQQMDTVDEEAAEEEYIAASISPAVVNLTRDSAQNEDVEGGNLNENDNSSSFQEPCTKETVDEAAISNKQDDLSETAMVEGTCSGSTETEDFKVDTISDQDELSREDRHTDAPDQLETESDMDL